MLRPKSCRESDTFTSWHSSRTRLSVSKTYTPMLTRQWSGSPGIVFGLVGFSWKPITFQLSSTSRMPNWSAPAFGTTAAHRLSFAPRPSWNSSSFA